MSALRQHKTGIALIILFLVVLAHLTYRHLSRGPVPISVNYHFTRKCNKKCGFCFHTAKTSHVASLEEAKHGLSLLKKAGMRKLNFAGGEPFLYPKYLGTYDLSRSYRRLSNQVSGELVLFGKQVLELESVSIVSNGSLIPKSWLRQYGDHLDILAISCDSFDEATNVKIGRGSGDNVRQLFRIRDWCREYGIKFKLNTVVCRYNFDEDMAKRVAELEPFRWKCFQVLRVEGENDSEETLRDVRHFEIKDDEFELFCKRHEHLGCFVPESNAAMAESYLILDEYLRFLAGTNKEVKSRSIVEGGVEDALRSIRWNQEEFRGRGGVYEWSKEELGSSGSKGNCGTHVEQQLDW
ncbi:hypothetical protein KVR01_001534 [Diaporthe batatas]|uniref:uncharacterized protein n=1 Tax=Diaporthe batatas TaxID=748121 RepID=UPI001D050E78|nr:uncharacterized protein KVR01_001534 [Diaporthe batatas]KAG8168785.1 hypothetical protein KVR01_001534 [Diaporthe batatas]